ncbi:MAG: response regulator [Bacteroidia bacterium]
MKFKIVLIDDHLIMLDGIAALLNASQSYEVVAQSTNPLEAADLVRKHLPHLLITDISMELCSGIDLCKSLRQEFPQLKIMALSMFSDKETITEMINAGVHGYILKNTGSNELIEALDKIMSGQVFFSNEVTLEMMKSITQTKISTTEQSHLTTRELEIVKLIADEFNNAAIGEKLFISERTVETHRKNIFRKTGTKSVAGLIKYAIEHKLI